MTDWSDPLLEPTPGPASRAFVALACAIVWLICAPVGIYARFAQRSGGDDGCEGADWGNERFHGDDF